MDEGAKPFVSSGMTSDRNLDHGTRHDGAAGAGGVDPVDISDDYELSYERMRPYYVALGQDDQEPVLYASVAKRVAE